MSDFDPARGLHRYLAVLEGLREGTPANPWVPLSALLKRMAGAYPYRLKTLANDARELAAAGLLERRVTRHRVDVRRTPEGASATAERVLEALKSAVR